MTRGSDGGPPSGPRLGRWVGRLVDRWRHLRNRLYAHAGFQRWAARFPPTRGVARARTTALFDLVAGFVYSQVLFACVRLRVLERLRDGLHSPAELAAEVDLPVESARRLLDAAASLRLVDRFSCGRYGLGIHGAAYVGNPVVARLVEHHALLYRDLADPVALLRGEHRDTELNRFWSYASGEGARAEGDVAAYSELMASSLPLIAEDILEAYGHDRHRSLLDVGGGMGVFVETIAGRAPHLSLGLFDLPPVAARARARLERVGLAGRVTVVGGDVFRDPLPGPVDVVSLVRVLHDHDDEAALAILRAARRALAPGGVVLVAEPMSGTRGAEPMGEAYFGFYLLAMGQGRPRSPDQVQSLMREAGLRRPRLRATRRPMLARLVVGEVGV